MELAAFNFGIEPSICGGVLSTSKRGLARLPVSASSGECDGASERDHADGVAAIGKEVGIKIHKAIFTPSRSSFQRRLAIAAIVDVINEGVVIGVVSLPLDRNGMFIVDCRDGQLVTSYIGISGPLVRSEGTLAPTLTVTSSTSGATFFGR